MPKKSVKMLLSLPKNEAIFALSQYLKQLKRQISHNSLVIESAVELNEIQMDELHKVFDDKIKTGLVKNWINPSILGGIRVTIGDMVYDASVSGKIKSLKRVIAGGI